MKTLTIIGRRWFQRTYGNTYNTAEVLINGKHAFKTVRQYGYGDHFRTIAMDALERIEASADEREELRESRSEDLETLTANSEFQWINPSETGDLTDAPMLGIRDGDTDVIVARWAYMDYQVRSFVDDLIEHGRAVFVS